MSNPSSPPIFATSVAEAMEVRKATKGIHRFRKLFNGLPFEASGTEAKNGGDEVRGFEDLEVSFGGVVALGAIDDGLGGGVPGDFPEGEGMAEEILGKAFAARGVVGGNGFLATVVDVEAGMFPGKEVGEFLRADEFGFAQGVEEMVAEEFDGGGEVFGGHAVEAAVGGKKAVGGEDVEVRAEDQVIAEGVDGGDGTEFAIGEVETGAEGVAEGLIRPPRMAGSPFGLRLRLRPKRLRSLGVFR